MNSLKNNFRKIKMWHIILLFFIINIFFLTNFPFVHSDEAWLSGLSRQIMETGNLAATESFFDLVPRNPHAIKNFFHLLQIVFIKIFDYQIFTFRLISLIAGTVSLFFFYKISLLISRSKFLSLGALIILAADIHFIYSSHLARQEIILVFIFLAAFYYFLKNIEGIKFNSVDDNFKNKGNHSVKKDIYLGLILGTSIGVHPNSFIISLPFIIIYTYKLVFSNKLNWHNYLSFALTLGSAALFFIYLSFQFDPNFINNYSNYGAALGVLDSFIIKIENLKLFYQKLFYRVSGTYYIPPIKFQLSFFATAAAGSLIKIFNKKNKNLDKLNLYLFLSLLAVNLALIIIGRYNQTSIIFIFPISYLIFINLIKNLGFKIKLILIIPLIIILSFSSIITINSDSHYNYQDYLQEIAAVVPKDARVLANLNTDYYFENGKLLDYRNLNYLADNNISFSEYIAKNKIKYIIYPEEMDFIYNTRPSWNIIYGNLYPYYSEMKTFLDKKAVLIKKFTNSSYAIRIVREIRKKNWSVKIYQVKNEAAAEAAQKKD
jgi:4-amino-4-deoxy-L-arabinose transferase-like glycosyltransferase